MMSVLDPQPFRILIFLLLQSRKIYHYPFPVATACVGTCIYYLVAYFMKGNLIVKFVYMSAVVRSGFVLKAVMLTCVLMLRLCLQFVSQTASAAYRTNKGMSVFDFGSHFLF